MTTPISPTDALSGLLATVAPPPSPNDLGRLAQMHTWGLTLAEGDPPAACADVDTLRLLARRMTVLLERIILNEVVDTARAAALLPGVVNALQALGQGQSDGVSNIMGELLAILGEADATPAAPPPATPKATKPETPTPAPTPPPAPAHPPYVSEPLILDPTESEHLQGFLDEATEHMDAIETALLEVETDSSNKDKLNELFRPFHTIKGIAGFLNLRDINRLTHEVETILDLGRKGERRITAATVDLIFAAVDTLKAQLAAIRDYMAAPTGAACPQPEIGPMMALLQSAAAERPDAPEASRPRLGEVLANDGAVCLSDVDAALQTQAAEPPPPRRLGEILVEAGVTTEQQVQRALARQSEGSKATLDTSIRVDTAKLDTLVDAVGELVIAQSMVNLCQKVREDDTLARNVAQVSKIVRDVQETAMAMRMVPIGHTFQKMRRVVRDVARKANKLVDLEISGEDTELDKNVIQQISDPLVHMVRNAIDHGIESPAERGEAGKPQTGRLHLHAAHQGDSIMIEVRDDGRGLDRERLIAKGIERGLITPDDHLTEQQAFALILHPGFSTAEKITDISGRGVGMDVVKRNVEQLRGKIEIHSEKGRGSTFSIRLPLTLAIIDGMIVRVGQERVIIPTILIEQSLRPEPRQITTVQRRGQMLQVRGRLCPLVQLSVLFDYGPPVDPKENLVVIVHAEGQPVGLVVEELIGQQQVVIKTLGERFKKILGISGAAILGDGRVGLILDPSGVLAAHNRGARVSAGAPVAPPSADTAPTSCNPEPVLASV